MATRADWDAQFGSGLRSQYDFTIYSAAFGTDLSYNNGDTYLLILTGADEEGQPTTEMLSVGDGWESFDGGVTIKHEKKGVVNKNSIYGKFCFYAGQSFEEAGNDYIFDKDSLNANTWVGLRFHMSEEVVGEAFTDRKTGKEVAARTRLMPTKFLGFDTDDAVAAPAVAPAAAPVQTAGVAVPTPPAATQPSETLIAIAKSSADFGAFVSQALQIPEVTVDESLTNSVIDSGPNGFYSLNH